MSKNFRDLELGEDLLDIIKKNQENRQLIKLDFIKIKTFVLGKTVRRMKHEATD